MVCGSEEHGAPERVTNVVKLSVSRTAENVVNDGRNVVLSDLVQTVKH